MTKPTGSLSLRPTVAPLLAPMLLAVAFAACQGEPDIPHLQATAEQPIVNGTAEPEAITLTDAQMLAIGWLHPRGQTGSAFCTATLIAPNAVVTAQHCTGGWSASDIAFGIGDAPNDPTDTFGAIAIAQHPSVDMAIIVLEEDATEAVAGLEPIPANTEAITSDDIGMAVQAAGYGETYDTNPPGRWFATVYLDEVDSTEIVVDGRGEQGICYGDSGGPVMWTGEAGPVVLAVESWGDSSCVDRDHLTRLDPFFDDFITPILNGELPPDPCEGIGRDGVCDGDTLKWCRRGSLRERDCAALGATCEFIDPDLGYGCTCGELDYGGRCNGNVVEYCDEGRIRSIDCAFRAQSCGYVDDETGYACVEGQPTCGPGTEAGLCQGSVLVSCTNGVTVTRNCGDQDLACLEDSAGASCGEADPGDPPIDDPIDPNDPNDPENPEDPNGPGLPEVPGNDPNDPIDPGQNGSAEEGCSQVGGVAGSPVALALIGLVVVGLVRRRRE